MRKSKKRLSTKSDERKGHEGQRDAMKSPVTTKERLERDRDAMKNPDDLEEVGARQEPKYERMMVMRCKDRSKMS